MLWPLLRRLALVKPLFLALIVSGTSALAAPRDPNGSIPPQLLPPAKNRSPQERTRSAEQALERALTVSWEEMAFSQVVQQLSATLALPIVLDPEGLDEAGVTTDQLVTFKLEDVRAGALFDLLLGPLHLVCEVQHGLLVITSEEKAAEHLATRVYNVRDLLTMDATPPPSAPAKAEPATDKTAAGFFFGLPSPVDNKPRPPWWNALLESKPPPAKEATPAESLMEAITETIDADTWTTAGGPGSLRVHGGLLIVTQNSRTLQKVENLLRDLRQAHAEPAVESVTKP